MFFKTVRSRGKYLAVLSVLTYGMIYMGRINISVAVDKMAAGFGTGVAAVGIFGSLQSLIYALGQFVNGYFINRWKSRLVIGLAALGTAAANILMGLTDGFLPALIIWCLNAYIQSLFWGAIIRIITTYPESQSSRSLMWMMLIIPIFTIISWTGIGTALDGVSDWHPYFWIPGVVILTIVIPWLILDRTCPETEAIQSAENSKMSVRELLSYVKNNGVISHCIISFMHGMISGGIMFWAPELIGRILTGVSISPYLVAGIIPMVKVFSSLALPRITGRSRDYRRLLLFLFAAIAVLCGAMTLFSGGNTALFLLLITAMTFMSNVIGSLLSMYVPLNYSDDHMSAPVAGILDAVIYAGSAAATYALGHIISGNDLRGAAILWLGSAAVAAAVLRVSTKRASS